MIVLALLGGLVLPGLAGTVLLGRLGAATTAPGAHLVRFVASGVGSWLILSGLLGNTVGLGARASWVATATVGLLSVVVVAVAVLRCRGSAELATIRADAVQLAWILVATAVSWAPIARAVFRDDLGPGASTPWYYWGLADQIARVQHVPASSVEFGMRVPFLGDYHLFSTVTAMLFNESGGQDVGAMRAVLVVAVVQLAIAAVALAMALGAGRLTSLVAVPVAVATGLGGLRLAAYRPEGFGIGLTLLVVACVTLALRCRDRGALAAAALATATVWAVHGIALTAAAAMLVGVVAATLPSRTQLRAHVLRVVGCGAVIAAAALAVHYAIGRAHGATTLSGLTDTGGIGDPTWAWKRANYGLAPSVPPDNLALARQALDQAYPRHAVGWAIAVAVVLALGLLIVRHRQPDARRALTFFVGAAIGLGVVVAFFALGWRGYVPRRTGSQRLLLEGTLLIGPLIACACATLPKPPGRWRWAPIAIVLATMTALSLRSSVDVEHLADREVAPPQDVRLLAGLHLQPSDVVLANAYSEGFVSRVTGGETLIEGRAPYTFPALLERSLHLLQEGAAYFRDPAAHEGLLRREHVDHVIVSRPGSFALGTGNVFRGPADLAALRRSPSLTEVAANRDLVVFRVDGARGR